MARILCPRCGTAFTPRQEAQDACPKCGYTGTVPRTPVSPMPSSGVGWFEASAQASGATAPVASGRHNPLAIASFVVGLIGFAGGALGLLLFDRFGFGFLGLLGLVAVGLGVPALNQIRHRRERGQWMAIVGILLGAIRILPGFGFLL